MAHPRRTQHSKLVLISHHQAFLLKLARRDLLSLLQTKVVLLFGMQPQAGWLCVRTVLSVGFARGTLTRNEGLDRYCRACRKRPRRARLESQNLDDFLEP